VSAHEVWGRWTDGPLAVLTFVEPLPARFTLVVTAAAYGPNVGRPAAFTAGTVTRTAVFGIALGHGPPEIRRLRFDTGGRTRRIEIRPYQPARPDNGDQRLLGLALVRLQIEPD
jgi:phosphoglycerol transferase